MNKLIVLLVAVILSSSAFAHDPFVRRGGGYGAGGAGYSDRHYDRHGQSIGRELIEVGIGGAFAIAAIQVGAAVGERVAREISGTPTQLPGVVEYAPQQIECRDMIVPVRDQFGRPLFDPYTGQQRVTRVRVC